MQERRISAVSSQGSSRSKHRKTFPAWENSRNRSGRRAKLFRKSVIFRDGQLSIFTVTSALLCSFPCSLVHIYRPPTITRNSSIVHFSACYSNEGLLYIENILKV
jgi:hypothetical protein